MSVKLPVGWVALAALAAVCVSCGGRSVETQLTINLGASAHSLRCNPPRGSAPDPAAICRALAHWPELLVVGPAAPAIGHSCPGNIRRATPIRVTGTYRGHDVDVFFTDNTCSWVPRQKSARGVGWTHGRSGTGAVRLTPWPRSQFRTPIRQLSPQPFRRTDREAAPARSRAAGCFRRGDGLRWCAVPRNAPDDRVRPRLSGQCLQRYLRSAARDDPRPGGDVPRPRPVARVARLRPRGREPVLPIKGSNQGSSRERHVPRLPHRRFLLRHALRLGAGRGRRARRVVTLAGRSGPRPARTAVRDGLEIALPTIPQASMSGISPHPCGGPSAAPPAGRPPDSPGPNGT
jgi:hypothetical protein